MVELTDKQLQAMDDSFVVPHQFVNPRTNETYVLLSTEEYERLLQSDDERPWTSEEQHVHSWEVGGRAGLDIMDEYDDMPAILEKVTK